MSRTLREYAEQSKRSLYEIAQAAGVDSGDIYLIADGKKGCRPETAEKIRLATDGAITEFDLLRVRLAWLASPEGQAEKARKRAAAQKKRRAARAAEEAA